MNVAKSKYLQFRCPVLMLKNGKKKTCNALLMQYNRNIELDVVVKCSRCNNYVAAIRSKIDNTKYDTI